MSSSVANYLGQCPLLPSNLALPLSIDPSSLNCTQLYPYMYERDKLDASTALDQLLDIIASSLPVTVQSCPALLNDTLDAARREIYSSAAFNSSLLGARDACQVPYCHDFGERGNPDITGIGIVLASVIEAFVALVVLGYALSVRNRYAHLRPPLLTKHEAFHYAARRAVMNFSDAAFALALSGALASVVFTNGTRYQQHASLAVGLYYTQMPAIFCISLHLLGEDSPIWISLSILIYLVSVLTCILRLTLHHRNFLQKTPAFLPGPLVECDLGTAERGLILTTIILKLLPIPFVYSIATGGHRSRSAGPRMPFQYRFLLNPFAAVSDLLGDFIRLRNEAVVHMWRRTARAWRRVFRKPEPEPHGVNNPSWGRKILPFCSGNLNRTVDGAAVLRRVFVVWALVMWVLVSWVMISPVVDLATYLFIRYRFSVVVGLSDEEKNGLGFGQMMAVTVWVPPLYRMIYDYLVESGLEKTLQVERPTLEDLRGKELIQKSRAIALKTRAYPSPSSQSGDDGSVTKRELPDKQAFLRR